ncbi:MAG: glycosyltransferase family 4 protein [Candidatus Binataceae bacterium]
MARVLIIAYTTFIHDGRVKRHAEALAARGDSVDVISLRSGHEGLQNGVNVIGIPIDRYRGASHAGYLKSYLRFFSKAARLGYRMGRVKPYDVVITCTLPDTAVLSALPARWLGSRVILDVHDTMPELYQDKFGGRRGAMGARMLMFLERACAVFADRVFAVHQLHRLRLEEAGIPARKITVVMNSPQPSIFNQAAARAGGSPGNCVLVCHGTITRRLGIDTAIKAVSLLVDRIPGLQMRVIGGGDYLEQARTLASRLNVSDHVRFQGMAPIEELPPLLRDATIGLVPNHASSATHLMLPVKLMEYAALGIPAIASRLRTVEHYFFGDAVRLVTPGDPKAMADAIEELFHDPGLRRLMALNALRIVRELSWGHQEANFFAAIDELASQRRDPGPGELAAHLTNRAGWHQERADARKLILNAK